MKTLIMSCESLEIHMFVCFSYSACPYMMVMYRLFHKTLPRSNVIVNWISVRFYETGCVFPENGSLRPLPVYSGIQRQCPLQESTLNEPFSRLETKLCLIYIQCLALLFVQPVSRKEFDQLISTLYILYIYLSVNNQLMRNLFEGWAVCVYTIRFVETYCVSSYLKCKIP